MNDKVLFSCANFERVPTRTLARLEGDQVLVPQLPEKIGDSGGCVLRHAANTHVAAGPPGKVGKCADVRALARGFDYRKLTAGVIQRLTTVSRYTGTSMELAIPETSGAFIRCRCRRRR